MYDPQYRSAYSDTARECTILGLNPSRGQVPLRSSTAQSCSGTRILHDELPDVIYLR